MPPPDAGRSHRSEAALHGDNELGSAKDPNENLTGQSTMFAGNVNLRDVQKTLGTNWTCTNAKTIADWMYMGSYQMKVLDLAIAEARSYIRKNAIVGIVLSTLTGALPNNLTEKNFVKN